jgi:transcriptional regulator GlxA family with amidase domain
MKIIFRMFIVVVFYFVTSLTFAGTAIPPEEMFGKELVESLRMENVKDVRKAAEQGDAVAQIKLFLIYSTGIGVKKDLHKGVQWLQKSADQGNQIALEFINSAVVQDYIARHYLNGENYTTAAKWFKKAAEQGIADAQFRLGLMYFLGNKGVPENRQLAISWLKKAALQGHAQAQEFLQDMGK